MLLEIWETSHEIRVLEFLSNKVLGVKACIIYLERLQRRCFLVEFLKILRAPILKNIWEQLLLSAS